MKPSERESSSSERLLGEEVFHDQKYSSSHLSPLHYDFGPTYHVFLHMKEMLGEVTDCRILEYGCGTGWITVELAAMGATIDAFDISEKAVESTQLLLKKNNLDNKCTLKKMNAEKLVYDSESFDYVFGFAILHHLDLSLAIPELNRVLKPGGTAFFAEPLGYNPFINLYRLLTPKFRTENERPIKFNDLEVSVKGLCEVRHEEFYLLALIPFVLIYIPFFRKYYHPAVKVFLKIDRFFLKKFPKVGKYAWYSVFSFQKSPNI